MMIFLRTYKLQISLALIVAITIWAFISIQRANQGVRAEARARFFEQYNRQQYLVAELASHSLDELFITFRRNLDLVVSMFDGKEVDRKRSEEVEESLNRIYGTLGNTPVIDMVVFDSQGVAVAIEPPDKFTLGRSYAWRDYYRWARDNKQPEQMYVTPFMRMEGGAAPRIQGADSCQGDLRSARRISWSRDLHP